jgi:hypothetical protein
LIRIRHGQKIR